MLSPALRRKLDKKMVSPQESYGRQIYLLHRFLMTWRSEQWLQKGVNPMGPSHIHLLFAIGFDGMSVTELARKAHVSKQAMSKLVQEMLKEGLIEIRVNEQDNRCNVVYLTDHGGRMLLSVLELNEGMTGEVEKRIGKVKSKRLLQLMAELVTALESGA